MLLQLENTDKDKLHKLLDFARQNDMKLSLVDDSEDNFLLPGKPLTPEQLAQLIEESRKSGVVSMVDGHRLIRSNYHGD